MEEKERILVSFSGGETSGFMCNYLIKNHGDKYDFFFVFANTGKEREETLKFVDYCDKRFNLNLAWVEAVTNPICGKGVSAKVVDFGTASRNGEPFWDMMKKHGLPNIANKFCTRELKDRAIRAYCRSIGMKKNSYKIAIGIRADEIDRVNWKARVKNRLIYPLIEFEKFTRKDVNEFWNNQDYRLKLKTYEGNCDLCFEKSDRKLFTIVDENRSLAQWWLAAESEFENFIPPNRNQNTPLPIKLFRKKRNMSFFLDKNNRGERYEPSEDERFVFNDKYTEELDKESNCGASCMPFHE